MISTKDKYLDQSSVYLTLHDLKSELMRDIIDKILYVSTTDHNIILTGKHGTGKHWFAHFINRMSGNPDSHIFYTGVNKLSNIQLINTSSGVALDQEEIHRIFLQGSHSPKKKTIIIDDLEELGEKDSYELLHIIEHINEAIGKSSVHHACRFIFLAKKLTTLPDNKDSDWKYIMNLLDPVAISIPPLEEHREDIPAYVNLFINRLMTEYPSDKRVSISPRALYKCLCYNWPGNVRQLKNAISHAFFHSNYGTIQPEHLPISLDIIPQFQAGDHGNNLIYNWSFIKAERNLLNTLKYPSNIKR